MWSLIAKFLLNNWRETALAFLTFALTLSISHGRKIDVEYKTKEVEWKVKFAMQEQSFATQVSQAKEREDEERRTYAATVATIKAQHAKDIAAVKDNAWRNYTARYGVGAALFGAVVGLSKPANALGVRGALPTAAYEAGKDACAPTPDGSSSEFVASCASDALRLNEWVELCQLNQCEVVE